MKKLLFILCLFSCISGFAQTEEETLDWLNTKKNLLATEPSYSSFTGVYTKKVIRFSSDGIELEENTGKKHFEKWSSIKEITTADYRNNYCSGVDIIFNYSKDDKPDFITLAVTGEDRTSMNKRFKKAFETMAKLKGAKLIKDDLF